MSTFSATEAAPARERDRHNMLVRIPFEVREWAENAGSPETNSSQNSEIVRAMSRAGWIAPTALSSEKVS